MISAIRYIIDGKSYELTNNGDGTWKTSLDAPYVAGRYDLLLEIVQGELKTFVDSSDPRYSFYLDVIQEIQRKVDLISHIPKFLRNSKVFQDIFNVENYELDLLFNTIDQSSLNVFIRTASIDHITILEGTLKYKGLGTLEQRRNYLLSLFQKGRKLNESLIRETANTITGSDCIITFYGSDEIENPMMGFPLLRVQVLSPQNNKDYRYDDIFRALKPLIPAHIQLSVEKFFSTWEDVNVNFADWNSIKSMNSWSDIKNYIPPQ